MANRTHHRTSAGTDRRKARVPPELRPGGVHPRSVPIEEPEYEDGIEPDQPFAEGVADGIDADLRHRLVSEAAYNLYQERGYADGYDLDDWLQAEESVDHLLVDRPGRVRRAGE